MFNIDKYLQKFSKGISNLEFNKSKIIEVINKYTNINIDKSKIEIKDYKIFIETNAVGKSQIFINKNKILNEINSFTDTKVVDIK